MLSGSTLLRHLAQFYCAIYNHADYSASGFGMGGGFGVNGKGEQGKWAAQGANTNGVVADNQQGKAGTTVTKSIGYGSDSGHDRSTTTSGINTSNIAITDAAGQNATGISVEQIKAQVKTDTTTDTVQANSGAIANNFDKDAVQKEIGLQVAVTQQFDTTRQGVKAEINKQVDKQQQAVKEAEAALKLNPNDQAAAQKLADANAAIENWQQGGVLVDMIAGGLSGPTSTGAAGTIANAAAPALQYAVGQYFKDQKAEGSTAHIVAHTVLAAAVAAAGGNDALTAGLSAGGAELLAPKVANWLFGNTAGIEKDENGNVIASKLTAEQKQTVSNIVSLGAAGLTAGAGGTGTDVVSSSQLASSAVEDNILTIQQKLNLEKAKKACDGSIFCEGWQEQKADWKSKQQDALIGKAKLQCAAFGDCGDIERWDKLFEDSMYYPAVVNQVRSVYPNLNDQQVYQIADEYIKESREEYSGFTRRAIANVIVMATSRGKNASAIRTTGGGKNAQHASEAAREAAKVKLDAAQAQMAQAKANGATKKEKAEIQRQIDHWRNKYQNSGENHSMKPKGNR